MREIDTTGTGKWTTFGQRDTFLRDYGGHALFNIGKILVAGGGISLADSRVIDINGATPKVTTTAPMAFGRRQNNLTVLADGSVLATGGNSSGANLLDLNAGVYAAEQWTPATGKWRTLAAMRVTRQYHSTALLLPDGRVLSAGGGLCGICDQLGYEAKNAEVFTPPYLYRADGTLAPRPAIGSAPAATSYGLAMNIATPQASAIRKVALVRLGAVTHSVNMEQRYIPLTFHAGTGSVVATAPKNASIAPPGYYMLFIVDSSGVPSVASMVSVQTSLPAAPASPAPAPAVAPAPAAAAPCKTTLRAPRRARAGKRLIVRYRACGPATLTAALRRRTAQHSVVRAHRVAAGRGRFVLSLRHVRPGRYVLRARLGHVRLTRRVRVTRS
jgi:hypothetical protein